MRDRENKLLTDILLAIDLIESFMKDSESFELYCADAKTKSAVERQLGIIGEAVNLFQKLPPTSPIDSASQIISLRNRIIHAYDAVDNNIIWAIVKRHLPLLKAEVSIRLSSGKV